MRDLFFYPWEQAYQASENKYDETYYTWLMGYLPYVTNVKYRYHYRVEIDFRATTAARGIVILKFLAASLLTSSVTSQAAVRRVESGPCCGG